MTTPRKLPPSLGPEFSFAEARALGVTANRLRASDLERPFQGVRIVRRNSLKTGNPEDPYREALLRELELISALGRGLRPGQFLSHRSAALLWGIPMPHASQPELHVTAVRPLRAPRITGATGHSVAAERCAVVQRNGVSLSDAPTTWASLGSLSLTDQVVAGDFLVRRHRQGYGRPNAGRAPVTTVRHLASMVDLGHWDGISTLRRSLELIREDSWSPRESATRLHLVLAGLPEPALNVDVFDYRNRFLACIDLAYVNYRIAIEYQGELHKNSYAHDIERIERLRAEGWIVIQVSRVLAAQPKELVRRVELALRSRGWNG